MCLLNDEFASDPTRGKRVSSSATDAFRIPSFRFQFGADLLTAWAIEMEVLLLSWYVLVQTDSAIMVALIGVARFGGTLLTPYFGTIADRLPRKRMLIAVRATFAVLSMAMATLALTGALVPWHAFAVTTLSGLFRPADMMLRQSLIGDTVPGDLLVSAMAFARTTSDSARIFGALAGASLMAFLGIGAAYVAVAAFYFFSALLSFGIAGAPGGANKKQNAQSQEHSALVRAYQDIKIGVLYVIEAPRIHALLWVAFLVNFSGLCITGGLLPIVARDVYGMDELGLGTLIATFATGALAGSLLIATVMRATRPDRLIIYSLIAWHVTLIGFAFTTSPAIGVPLLGVVGLLSSLVMVPLASTLVAIAGVEFRGRVMGLRQLAVVGLPLGLLLAGLLIEVINITTALVTLSAVGVILGIALAAMWQRITGTSLR